MFPGSPTPVRSNQPFGALLRLAPPGRVTGVWVGGSGPVRGLCAPGPRGLLLAPDLGRLLRRCDQVIVRDNGKLVCVPAAMLIGCRVLRVVLGTPYLPRSERLRALFPGAIPTPGALAIPLGAGSAEEALALCAAERIRVQASSIGYRAPSG